MRRHAPHASVMGKRDAGSDAPAKDRSNKEAVETQLPFLLQFSLPPWGNLSNSGER